MASLFEALYHWLPLKVRLIHMDTLGIHWCMYKVCMGLIFQQQLWLQQCMQPKYRIAENFRGRKLSWIGEKYDFQRLLAFAAPKDITSPSSLNFTEKTFANSHKTAKFTKVFSLKSSPLYSTKCNSLWLLHGTITGTDCPPAHYSMFSKYVTQNFWRKMFKNVGLAVMWVGLVCVYTSSNLLWLLKYTSSCYH